MAIFPEEMAMTKKTQATDRERRWRETFERFARSGLNVRAFCRQESLPESAFYFWRRELARRDGERPSQPKSRPYSHAIGAVCRKLIQVIYGVLKSQTPFHFDPTNP